MVKIIWVFLRSFPMEIIIWKAWCKTLRIKIPERKKWQQLFENKKALEIGGPSGVFGNAGYLPLYSLVQKLDGVNFDENTVWEGTIKEGEYYRYDDNVGHQFIAEGTNISQIQDGCYDCILSSNNLEHFANPLKALFEWKRILKSGGVVILVLPNKTANFDHRRPYTSLEHIISDFANDIQETDLSHVPEILKLHDFSRDPQAGGYKNFEERCKANIKYRCIHHHVYSQQLLKQMLDYTGMKLSLIHI